MYGRRNMMMAAAMGAQPQAPVVWMQKPAGDGSPLSYFKPLNSLSVKQVVSVAEMFTGFASQSKYGVYNDKGEQVFYAFEESDTCQRMCCTKNRSFILHVVDNTNQEVIRISREFRCCAGTCAAFACCDAFRQEITVECPPGTVIGHVSQECTISRPQYGVKDASDNLVMVVRAPFCICDGPYACCCENKFTIYGTDRETEIGAIKKKYRGFVAEAYTSADEFAIQFPGDLDSKMKALALGALFLIDFAHFSVVEHPNQ